MRVIIIATIATIMATTATVAEPRVSGTAKVVDGDSIHIGPVRVRLHGIDAPEAGQRCGRRGGGTWPCGERATARLAELADGRPVACAVKDRDIYGRLIAVCTSGKSGDLNALMVREGFAWAFRRFSQDYVALEDQAKAAGRGIWQGEAEAPWDYRANRWARAAAASPRKGCPIKGNINRKGEKIYHTPWSPWYDRVKVDTAAGQRWFCDEKEAIDAGWRPARAR